MESLIDATWDSGPLQQERPCIFTTILLRYNRLKIHPCLLLSSLLSLLEQLLVYQKELYDEALIH